MSENNNLIVLEKINATTVFGVEGGSKSIIDKIKEEVSKLKLDASTKKGREEIISVAYRISKSKTFLDGEGKKSKEGFQKAVDLVDAERKKIRDELDELKASVREPVTKFENAEKLRISDLEERIALIKALDVFDAALPELEIINERLLKAEELSKFEWMEFEPKANFESNQVINKLNDYKEQRELFIKQQEEIEKNRIAESERQAVIREEAVKAEAIKAEREKAETEKAEAKAKEDALIAEKAELEEKVRLADEAKIKAEADRKQKALDDAKKAEDDKIEAKKLADEQTKKAVEDEKKRAEEEVLKAKREEESRAADKKHKSKINNSIMDSFKSLGCDEDLAKKIITSIVRGEINNTTIKY